MGELVVMRFSPLGEGVYYGDEGVLSGLQCVRWEKAFFFFFFNFLIFLGIDNAGKLP